MNIEKLIEVFSDKAFVEEIFSMDTAKDAQAALAQKGIDMTAEELIQIRKMYANKGSEDYSQEKLELLKKQTEDGEINEDELESVSGGLMISSWILIALCAIGGGGVGAHIFGDKEGWW